MRFRRGSTNSKKAKSKSLPSVFPAESSVETIEMLKQYANAVANDESTSACELCGVKFHSTANRNASATAGSPNKTLAKTCSDGAVVGGLTDHPHGSNASPCTTLKDMNANSVSARRICFVDEKGDGFHSIVSLYYFDASQVYLQLFQALRASRAPAPLLTTGLGASSVFLDPKAHSPTAQQAEASQHPYVKPGSRASTGGPLAVSGSPPTSEIGSNKGSGSGRPPYILQTPPASGTYKCSPEADQVQQLTNSVLSLLNSFCQLVSGCKTDSPGRFVTQLLSVTIPTLRVFFDWVRHSQTGWHLVLTGHAFVGEEKNTELLVTLIVLHRQLMQIHEALGEMDKLVETLRHKTPDSVQLPCVLEEFQSQLYQTHMYLALLTNAILDNGARLTSLFLKPFKSYTLKSTAIPVTSMKSTRNFQIDLGECMTQTFLQRFANEFLNVVSPSSSYLFPLFLDKCLDVSISELSQCEMAKMVDSIIQSIDLVRLWAVQRETEYNAKVSQHSAQLHLSNINAFLRLEVIRALIQETPGFIKSSRFRMDPFRKLARNLANRTTSIGTHAATAIQGHLLTTMGRNLTRPDDSHTPLVNPPAATETDPAVATPPGAQRRTQQKPAQAKTGSSADAAATANADLNAESTDASRKRSRSNYISTDKDKEKLEPNSMIEKEKDRVVSK